MKHVFLPGLVVAAVSGSASAQTESYNVFCDYMNLQANLSYRGRCVETWNYETGEHSIRAGQVSINLGERSRQGVWQMATWNGRPAVRYEHDRTRYSYATEDLQEFLEVARTLAELDR